MEFKNIQRNHPVYLLDKQTVEVKEGKVVDNQPHINTGIATISSSGQPMRDVTIEVEQETEKRFKALEGDISGIRGMVKQLLDKLG